MAGAYLTSRKIYAYISDAWVDLSADVLTNGNISANWGMKGNEATDLVADTGQMNFTLSNRTGKYSPDGASALAGWGYGLPIKLVLEYDGQSYIKFRGLISQIKLEIGATVNDNYTSVTVLDWMDYASRHPVINPAIQDNLTGDQVIDELLAITDIPAQATLFETGNNIFRYAFDLNNANTTVYAELAKIAYSEWGYVYLRKNILDGEELVFENELSRNGQSVLSGVPLLAADSGLLLREDGDFLLQEDGSYLVLDENQDAVFESGILSLDMEYGKRVLNYFSVTVFPRVISVTLQNIFYMQYAFAIGSGETIEITGTYSEQTSGRQINARAAAIVPGTSFQVFTSPNGGGTDITADCTVVAPLGSDGFTHQIANNSAYNGYVYFYVVRGYAITVYNPVKNVTQDADSIRTYGYKSQNIDQKYQQSTEMGIVHTKKIIELERRPRTVVNGVSFSANRSSYFMQSFLNLDVGDMIQVTHDDTGTDSYFYIQGVNFTIGPGGIIMFGYVLQAAVSLTLGLSHLGVRFNMGADTKDIIDFGYNPMLASLAEISISAWIYVEATSAVSQNIIGTFSDASGYSFLIGTDGSLGFYQKGATGAGLWKTAAGLIALNTLYHVVVTRITTTAANDALFYIDSVIKATTEANPQAGATIPEVGSHLLLGNLKTVTYDYARPFYGKISGVRIYNKILDDEIAQIYNAGITDVSTAPDSLIFQAPCVRTKDLALFDGEIITSDMRVLDNLYGISGAPNGTPEGFIPV